MTCDHILDGLSPEHAAQVKAIAHEATLDPKAFTPPPNLHPKVAEVAAWCIVTAIFAEADKWGITACSEPLRVALKLAGHEVPSEAGAEGS